MADRSAELRATLGAVAATLRNQDLLGVSGDSEMVERVASAAQAAVKTLDAQPVPSASPSAPIVTPSVAPPTTTTASGEPPRPAPAAQPKPAESPAANSAKSPSRATGRGATSDESLPWVPRRDAAPTKGADSEALKQIRADLGDCERCGLCARRTNIVFGVGNPTARLMFVGDSPGPDEDRQGEPFVGKAGQLLTKMIGAMGFSRSEVYIANVVKCRPPGNRDPQSDEVAACRPFLERQIEAVQPEVIVTLGSVAAASLLGRSVAITEERGSWTAHRGVPLLLTLHPAYLLREPRAKADAWADLQLVMKRLGLERPGR